MGVEFELEESNFKGYIPDGEILPARVIGVENKKQRFQDKETGEDVYKVEFKFEITDEDSPFDAVKVYGRTGTRFNNHPGCKLFSWAQGILGMELVAGYRLDTDDLLDQDCRVIVKLDEYNDKTTGVAKQRNEVVDVMPSRQKMENFAAVHDDNEPF